MPLSVAFLGGGGGGGGCLGDARDLGLIRKRHLPDVCGCCIPSNASEKRRSLPTKTFPSLFTFKLMGFSDTGEVEYGNASLWH